MHDERHLTYSFHVMFQIRSRSRQQKQDSDTYNMLVSCCKMYPLTLHFDEISHDTSHVSATTGRLLESGRRNEEVREKTKLQKSELIIKERRLKWFERVLWLDDGGQVMHWEVNTTKRRLERRRRNWINTILHVLGENTREVC